MRDNLTPKGWLSVLMLRALANIERNESVATAISQDEDRLLSVEEAAGLLGVSPYMVREWAREQKIPAIRVGKRYWRFRRSSLNAWINERERAPR